MITEHGFIKESLAIEGIHRQPTEAEVAEHHRFMQLPELTVDKLERFVSVFQPQAKLRDRAGANVRIGDYYPPPGGMHILYGLQGLLSALERNAESAFRAHHVFETLHPFTDCNGRLGRMIWLWQMRETKLPFLHAFYYQSLQYGRAAR